MPGLVNTHSHLTEILQRSLRDNVRMESWKKYRAATEEMANPTAKEIGAAAELACAEMLKNGVTAVVDHFSTRPGLSETKMKAILAAFERTGIRGVLTPSLSDQDFLRMISAKSSRSRLPKARVGERWQDQVLPVLQYIRKSSTISDLMLGPSSPFNCSDSLLREVVETAEQHDLGIHMHLLETRLQRWVDGKVVVRGGRLTRVREEMLMRKVAPISKKMRKRYSAILRSEARNGESSLQKLYRNAFKDDERNFRS